MAWPFVRPVRPLMRDVLFWWDRGELPGGVPITSWEQIGEYLAGPEVRHHREDVEAAIPEARRALYFREEIQRAADTKTFAEIWLDQARAIWYAAYGREPTREEMEWWTSRPGPLLGMMFELTVQGIEGYRRTYTINASWGETLSDVRRRIEEWYRSETRSPPPPGSVAEAVTGGAALQIVPIGGALVPRIDPTIT